MKASSLAVATAVLLVTAGAAHAHFKRPPTSYPKGYVVAESEFGNGSVTGAVRPGPNGWQVQTPGGNWIYCRRSCSETLRVETVDFWEKQRGITQECGIFGCLEIKR